MSKSSLRVSLIFTAAFCCLVASAPGAHANIKICQGIEQSYEQIARGASTVEINDLLFKATDKGCQDLARRLLLEAGASLEARDRLGAKPLSHAAAAGQIELAVLFLDHGAPIDARNLDGSTALFKAAETGRLDIVKLLVERGASVDLPGRSGVTPLSAAAFMGSAPIVDFLIEKGADPNWMDGTQKTAIVYAVGRAFPAVCTVLLAHGVDVNAKYGNDLTALMWAAGYSAEAGVKDAVDVMTLFIDRGARLDDQDNRGRTALMIAAELNHAAAVDLLLARGADKTLKDKQGKTAADLTTLTALREKLAAAH
jgi:ankyrin repeat protein